VNTAPHESRLRARLAELIERMKNVETDLEVPLDPDPEERSVEREDDETLQNLGSSAMTETKKIRAALDRIAKGTFGVCADCGGEISAERLELIPHAARCRQCI